MALADKDTIYIDIDDEITVVIDKLRGSQSKLVALVLPKRAAVFQSIVNMKLLKRAADGAKKNLVLITSETGLLPLAGVAGIFVAKTLTSKPEIPAGPQLDDNHEENVDEAPDFMSEPELTKATAGDKPVGQLAGLGATALAGSGNSDEVETLELDDDVLPEDTDDKPSEPKAKKNKKLRIPDFNRFRLLLALGILLLILLIGGIVAATQILPKAVITIKTDATKVNVNQNLNLSTTAATVDPATNTLPAKFVTQAKTYSQQVAATGQQNNGTAATGKISMTAQECAPNLGNMPDVPAGTGVTSSGHTYITQKDTTFSFSGGHGSCNIYKSDGSTDITAQGGGASYNVADGTTFTVANHPEVTSATGSASGGTDNIVQTVSQADIQSAQNKISTTDPTVKQALQNQLTGGGYYPLPVTFSSGTPTITSSSNAGDKASSVTVTEVVTYSMFGVVQNDLKTLLDKNINTQIDTAKQSILSEGLDNATFNLGSSNTTSAVITLSSTATAGPHLDINSLKKEVMGKKSGDVQSLLSGNPDVASVDVKLSPFFVTTVPTKTNKITIIIASPTSTKPSTNNNAAKP